MTSEAAIITAMLSLPQWSGDPPDLDRREYHRPMAAALARVTRNPERLARMISVMWHETRFATLVFTGRCDEMPKGQRCDDGEARGLFQLHRAACLPAYALAPGTIESFEAEARCADKRLEQAAARWATDLRDCPSAEVAAFAGYGGRRCPRASSVARAETALDLLGEMFGHGFRQWREASR